MPRLHLWALVLLLGCATQPPPPPPQQPPPLAGIAELVLPADAASLRRTAASEERAGGIETRRGLLAGVHRQLLMAPPDDALVPELFDVLAVMAPRVEAGEISPAWASYLYTTYLRDLHAERPAGAPRRSTAEVTVVLDGWVEYYHVRATPRPTDKASATATGTETSARDAEFQALREYRNQRRLGR